MSQSILIDTRYCGPPDSGNGGYAAGLIAPYFDGSVEVELRRPLPLGRPLELEWFEEHEAMLCDGDEPVATAGRAEVNLEVPAAPSYEDAVGAARRRIPEHEHPFPGCFVCGPARAEGDGLRIFPGQVGGRELVAAPWIPERSLADSRGVVQEKFVLAALDCPGGFAAQLGREPRAAVLGRFAAAVDEPVQAGERYVVVGWRTGGSGRTHDVGTALFRADGRRAAVARGTWVDVK